MQVYGICEKSLHRFHWIVPGYIMGGENRAKEKARLRKGLHFYEMLSNSCVNGFVCFLKSCSIVFGIYSWNFLYIHHHWMT